MRHTSEPRAGRDVVKDLARGIGDMPPDRGEIAARFFKAMHLGVIFERFELPERCRPEDDREMAC